MNRRTASFGPACVLPLGLLLSGCSSSSVPSNNTFVYVSTMPDASGRWADPSVPPSIMAFSAGADGQLTPQGTTTLPKDELILGANRSYVFTAEALYPSPSNSIHEYRIGSNGALTGPVATVDPRKYDGGAGAQVVGPAVMDRSGQHLTVFLSPNWGSGVNVWQTYKVAGDGTLSFVGYDTLNPPWADESLYQPTAISAVSGNNQYGYGSFQYGYQAVEGAQFAATKRDLDGTLRHVSTLSEVDPVPYPLPDCCGPFMPYAVAADASNHLAVVEETPDAGAMASTAWLASFTIDDATGAIQSTNRYDNMPQMPTQSAFTLALSPQGDFAAVGGYYGFRLFHFNGAAPATPDGDVLLGDLAVTQLAWDGDHHLYVLANTIVAQQQRSTYSLYVYTVTDAGIVPAPGSPWSVPNSYGLTVVPRSTIQ